MKPLTARQQAALENIAAGMTYTAAGRAAGYTAKSAPAMVSRLVKRPDAKELLAKIGEKATTPHILSVIERKEFLSGVVKNQESLPTEAMAAIHLLNKMEGVYLERVETEVRQHCVMIVPDLGTGESWEKRAMKSQAALKRIPVEV